jgi:uncharacterized membrane protein
MTLIKKFVFIASFFGVWAVILIPPFQSPDEYNHWYRAYQISEGIWKGIRTNDARLGGEIPISMQQCVSKFKHLKFNYERKTGADTIWQTLKIPLQAKKTSFIDFTNTAMYAPTAYIPQVIILFVLKKMNAPALLSMYLGRLGMLICWIGMICIALKIMPFRKETLCILALLPASIFINATLNADIVTNGLCFIIIAWSFKIAEEKKDLSSYQEILFGAIIVIIALNKIIYTPLLFLRFIHLRAFPNPRKVVFTVLTTFFLSGAVIVCWQMQTQPLYLTYEQYHPQYVDSQELLKGVNPSEQFKFVVEHPFHLIKILIPSYLADAGGMMSNYVGKFGWEANFLPRPMLACLFLMILIQILKDFTPLSLHTRLYVAALGAILCIVFAVVMYALWCPVGDGKVWNFQGRYFIPIFPLFLLALPYWNVLRYDFFSKKMFYIMFLLTHIYSMFQILGRYYF